jgi:hypothetical protein
MKEDYMIVKLNFSNELAISSQLEQDLVVFHIKEQRELFISETLLQSLSENYTTLIKKVPKQMIDSPVSDTLIGVTEGVELVLKGSLATSFSFGIVFTGAFALMLSMINPLQIIMHLSILHVPMPGNVQTLFQTLMPIITFDILENLDIFENYFADPETQDTPEIPDQM